MAIPDDKGDEGQLIQAGFRYALSLTHHRQDAEDLLQQACLKVIRAKNQLVSKPYLFVAIRNLFFDDKRKARGQTTTDPVDHIADPTPGHEVSVDTRNEVEHLLGMLRPVERETLFLNVVEGYTADEIAQMTGQPRGTVLTNLSRAKQRLRKHVRVKS